MTDTALIGVAYVRSCDLYAFIVEFRTKARRNVGKNFVSTLVLENSISDMPQPAEKPPLH